MQKPHFKFLPVIISIAILMILPSFILNSPVMPGKETTLIPTKPGPSNAGTFDDPIVTDYNIYYRMVKYAQAKQYRSDNAPAISAAQDMLDIVRFEGLDVGGDHYPGSYRMIVLRNGTLYLMNVTGFMAVGQQERKLLPGYGYQNGMEIEFVAKYNYDLTNFEPQIACQYSTSGVIDTGVSIWGRNLTNNAIAVHCIKYNSTGFTQIYNFTIPNPVLFPGISNVKIYHASPKFIAGKFIDSGSNVPFAYSLNDSLGLAGDITNLTTSITDYQAFDDCVLSVQSSSMAIPVIGQYVITNKHIIMLDTSGVSIKYNIEMPVEILYSAIPTYKRISNVYIFNSSSTETIYYAFMSLNSARGFYVTFQTVYNATSFTYEIATTIQADPNVSFLTQQIEPDNIFKSMLDFTDGQFFNGMDTRFKNWQTWDVRTGSVSNIWFDWYIPYKIIKYDNTYPALEVWWGDSRGIWFTQFNGEIDNILTIGNSSVSHVVNQRVDVSHAQGTDSFQFTISGYLERNTSDICEVGLIPLIGVGLGDLTNPNPRLFTINKQYEFLNILDGGVVLRPKINFQGTGSKIIEFFVSFESEFCPIIKTIIGLNYVAYNVYFLAWERYNNGTYTQKVLTGSFEAKSALFTYSFALETGISIQDSHMLDELHFFSNGLEYSPYNVFLTSPNSSILVTDKVTNDTLFDDYVMFQDPLPLPIPAKYEFYCRLYSTIDNYGFPFELCRVYVNGTQVTTPSVRVLSPSANIVVRDFSDLIVLNKTIHKNIDGQYIDLGLPIASIVLSNQYSFTVDFFLTRNDKTIYYQLPPDAMIILRLALGEYHYIALDLNGTELEEKDITFKATDIPSITLGKKSEPEAVPIPVELNIIIAVIAIAGITGAGIVLASLFKRGPKKNKRMPWG